LPGGLNEVTTMHLPRQKELKPRAYSARQVSEITNLGLRKINTMISDGRLKAIKIDGRRLIYASSVEALLPDDAAD
jgi:excisionase family DNA binding protein